jgi:hypothetical protein
MKGHPHGNTIWQSGNDQVDLSANAPVLSDNFTLEAWVYSDNITLNYHWRSIMGSEQGVNAANLFTTVTSPTISYIKGFGAEGISYGFGTGTKKIKFHAEVNIPVKVWHHIATTFDGTNYILYMNGEVVDNNTVTAGDTPAATPVRYIGTDFIGKIDEVRMWSVARTQAEIQANMNKTLVGNETGLVAYYPMAVSDNYTMIIDNSSNANHAKISDAQVFSKYFSSECSSGPDGSSECPYPTILSAIEAVRGKIHQGDYGHRIVIKEGRYPEVILLNGLNKNGQQAVIVEGETGKEVILDGTIELKADWNDDNGDGIYETVLDMDALSTLAKTQVEKIYGVYVGNRYMIPALPMNVKNPTDRTKGNYHNPEPGTVWSWHKEIYQLMGPDDNMTLDVGIGPDNSLNWLVADPSNLDSLEEWAFDNESKKLYLYASENFIPSQTNVRVRIRDRFVSINESDKITLKNIHFFAGSLELIDSDYLTIEDSRFSFSSDIPTKMIRKNYHTGNFLRLRNSIFVHILPVSPDQATFRLSMNP